MDPERAKRQERTLLPYIPRLVADWITTDPDRRWLSIEGSLVFVDISGFTKMSERLARRGRIGAEEVTDVLNATFTRLLDVAYSDGGGLLKFGGDALLLLFEGDEHQRRACRAAAGMRRTLREFGTRMQTSAGFVTLRMSVGVDSGTLYFFLVGSSHRELIIAGPAASGTVANEHAANAGEIMIGAATAAAVEPRALGVKRGPGVLLRSAPAPGATFVPPAPMPVEEDLIASCVPLAIRRHLAEGSAEAEHRQATVAFVHFEGVDEMLATEGPDRVAGALDELVETAQRAAEENAVGFLYADVDGDGGKMILVGGVPTATGSDEEGTLRAARAVADSGSELPLRIGLHRGPVFAGDVGGSRRRTYTIMGDAVNTAARVMSRAEPGEILATPDVLDRSRTLFATQPLAPFAVKGKAQPVVAHRVGEIAGPREHRSARGLPFVGREREMALAQAALEQARHGHGGVLDLVGDAGIGKTRFVEELRRHATDFVVVATASEPYASSTPYYAFRGLLRTLLSVEPHADAAEMTAVLTDRISAVAPHLVPWMPLLAIPLDVTVRATRSSDELDPKFRKARLHAVVTQLVSAILGSPTLLVFEDAYWMDDASRELFLDIATQKANTPWLMCVTRRPYTADFQPPRGMPTTTIKLEPLSDAESADLAHASAEGILPPGLVASLTERSGGNPLFLQELTVAAQNDPSPDALPSSIEAVVTARIDTLPPRDRAVLRYASVLGTAFSTGVVTSILVDAEAVDAATWDRLGAFLEREGPNRFRFHHVLFRDVAYEGLPFRRRRDLHQAAGEYYERRAQDHPDEAELLSLHFHRAQLYEKAWRYSVASGRRAQAKYANVEAAEFYRRALDAARRIGGIDAVELSRVYESMGDVCELAALYPDASTAYGHARRLTRIDGRDRGDLLMKEGVLRERAGRYSDALRWYARGLRTGRNMPPDCTGDRAKLTLASAGVLFRQARFEESAKLAKDVAESGGAERRDVAHAYYLLHTSYTHLNRPERAQYRDLALPIFEELGDLDGQSQVLNNLGIDAYFEGRWQDSLDLWTRGQEVSQRLGDVVGVARQKNNIGEVLSDQGYLKEAEALFREAEVIARGAGYRILGPVARSNLGRAAARAGRIDDARELIVSAMEELIEIKAKRFILEAEMRLAECAAFAGDDSEALNLATPLLERVAAAGGMEAHLSILQRIIGEALMRRGDAASAGEALTESLRLAREGNAAYEEAFALMAISRLGGDASQHAAEARAIFDRLGVLLRSE